MTDAAGGLVDANGIACPGVNGAGALIATGVAGVAVYLVSQETKDVGMVNKSRKKKAG